MTTAKARTGKPTKSRAHTPEMLDFNRKPKPAHKRAAAAVSAQQLERLFERLDRADERFSADATTSTFDALAAVVDFLKQNPRHDNIRFWRPLDLLLTEIRNPPKTRPQKGAKQLFALGERGSGGVNTETSQHHVKAAAAYTLHFLFSKCGESKQTAAKVIAEQLEKAQFDFGKRRKKTDTASAVEAWLREYPERSPGGAAKIFRKHVAAPPVRISGIAKVDAGAIRTWFTALLVRAGYGETV